MSVKSSAMPVGLQVVKLSQTPGKRYEVDEEALTSVLLREDIRHLPVMVVSVAGAYRGGKSFLLNFFLRYLNASRPGQLSSEWMGKEDEILKGFEWRGGAESNTKGIHLWPEPIIVDIEQTGEKVAVLLMDTQGTFDTETDMNNNSTIFALSTLLSSVQIYNLRSNIGGDDLQHLQLFTKYGKLVSGEEKKAFQSLIFLVRDWMSPYEHPYGYNGGQALLDKKLQVKKNQTNELQEVCQQIRSCFEKLQCFLMPHPGLAVADQRFTGRLSDITQDFRNSLLELVPSLFNPNNLTPKIINGDKIQAQDLLEYFKQYVNVFNSGDMPEVSTMFQATVIASLMTNLREARQLYENKMKSNVFDDDSTTKSMVQQYHNEALNAAVELYKNKKTLCSQEDVEKYLETFKKELNARLELFQWQNDAKVRKRLSLAKKSYEDAISSVCAVQMHLCLNSIELQVLHEQALLGALRVFQEARSRVPQEQDEDRIQLKKDLVQRYQALCTLNDQNNKSAILEARESYISNMKVYVDQYIVSSTTLITQHKTHLEGAVRLFNMHRNRPTDKTDDSYLEQLKQDISNYYDEYERVNSNKIQMAMDAAEREYSDYMIPSWTYYTCYHPKIFEARHEEKKAEALRNLDYNPNVIGEMERFKYQLYEKLNTRFETLEYINHSRNSRAVSDAFWEYKNLMDEEATPSISSILIVPFILKLVNDLPDCHNTAKARAHNKFYQRRTGGGSYWNDKYVQQLDQKIADAYHNYVGFTGALSHELGF